MTTNATHSAGVTLSRDGNTIAEVTSINGVGIGRDAKAATTLAMTADEYLAGRLKGNQITVGGFLYPGDTNGQIGLYNDVLNKTNQTFALDFPSSMAAQWTFTALVTGFNTDIPTDDGLPFLVALQPQGAPVLNITESTGLTTPYFAISESAVIMPDPAGDVYTYVATVLTGVSSVTVTPTATAGTITVNGTTVTTGVASGAITLGAAGSVTEIEVVVKETNKIAKTYTIYLARAAS